MKKTKIHVGGYYANMRGTVRHVVGKGPEFVLYDSQVNTDTLRYKIIKKSLGPGSVGDERSSTTSSFAAWAIRELNEAEISMLSQCQ